MLYKISVFLPHGLIGDFLIIHPEKDDQSSSVQRKSQDKQSLITLGKQLNLFSVAKGNAPLLICAHEGL